MRLGGVLGEAIGDGVVRKLSSVLSLDTTAGCKRDHYVLLPICPLPPYHNHSPGVGTFGKGMKHAAIRPYSIARKAPELAGGAVCPSPSVSVSSDGHKIGVTAAAIIPLPLVQVLKVPFP